MSFIEGLDCGGTISDVSEFNHIQVTTSSVYKSHHDLKASILLSDPNHSCSLPVSKDNNTEGSFGGGCDSMKEVVIVDQKTLQKWKADKILSFRWSLFARASTT